jgi:hypothetical protein
MHVPENEPLVEGLAARVTCPVGVNTVPEAVSVTVTVQVVGALTGSGEGEHVTDVEVVLKELMTVNVVEPVLPA